MQKLKYYLSALIEAVFGKKKAFIAQQAMPSNSSISVGQGLSSYVATEDGYLRFLAKTTNAQSPWFNVDVYNGISAYLPAIGFQNGISSFAIPVKKGDSISFKADNCEIQNISLFKLVGGGLNSILESGGALCLRLKNTLARSLNSVAGKQCRQTRLFKWEHQKTESHLTTLHRAMGTSVCESLMRQTQHSPKSRLQRTKFCLSFQPTHLLERLAYQLKKVKLYQLSHDMKRRAEVPVSSFQLSAQANLAIRGGTL